MNVTLPQSLRDFLFHSIASRPFVLMRRAWAVVVFMFLLLQWQDIAFFYGAEMFLPYLLLLGALFFVSMNWGARLTVIICVLLLLLLHQKNSLPMGGGDLLLYTIGFLLVISPGIFSEVMPIWPQRLLLWQLVVLYGSSLWTKLLGETWIDGTAVGIALQHPHFARFDLPRIFVEGVSPLLTYMTLGWEAMWLLLLIPGWKKHDALKQFLLVTGVIFHIAIAILFDVGSFSFAVLVAYVGLLSAKEVAMLTRS